MTDTSVNNTPDSMEEILEMIKQMGKGYSEVYKELIKLYPESKEIELLLIGMFSQMNLTQAAILRVLINIWKDGEVKWNG